MLIKRTRASVTKIKDVFVYPGINNIPAEKWDEIKDDSFLAGQIECGNIEIIASATKEAPQGAPGEVATVAAVTVAEAREIIEAITNTETLAAIEAADSRKAIKKAAAERLAELTDNAEKSAALPFVE